MDLTRLIPIYTTVDKICIETGESINKKMPCLFDPELNVYYCDASLTFVHWFNIYIEPHEEWKKEYILYLNKMETEYMLDLVNEFEREEQEADDRAMLMSYYDYNGEDEDFQYWLEANGLD